MKKMRKLIPAFAMLMVAAIMMTTASFAWFSMGTTASATGMQITAEADSSLVIALDTERATFVNATNTVSLASQNKSNGMAPATHDDGTAYPDGLKYVTNADTAVDPATGIVTAPTYDAADKDVHFVEYKVYIASAGGEISGKTLQVSLNNVVAEKYMHKALTIDFWIQESKTGTLTYKDSISILDYQGNSAVKVDLSTATIPQAIVETNTDTANDYMTIVMRVYFDGAMEDKSIVDAEGNPTGATYVRNAMITATEVALGLKFAAVS